MKILVATQVIPSKKNKLIKYVANIADQIKKITSIEIFWLIYQPESLPYIENKKNLDIHDFKNAIEVLEKIKPDCILANNNAREPINYSLTIAANYLKIPVVFYYLNDHISIEKYQPDMTYKKHFIILLRNLFSNKIPTDTKNDESSMRRAKFFHYKNMFLFNTRRSIGINFLKSTKFFINDLVWYLKYKKSVWSNCADLNLCPNEVMYHNFIKNGIDLKKIKITGNPYWDKIFEKMKLRENGKNHSKTKIRVLIVTSGLVEHGFWSVESRKKFFRDLFINIGNNDKISFDLKIHPASEDKEYYKKLLSEHNLSAQIFQKEDFWDIVNEFDMVLSYGSSTIHTECAFGGIKMILLDMNWNFKKLPLVGEAISSGFFVECKKFEDIQKAIYLLDKKNIEISKKLVEAREKMTFKFDGKAGERVASEIIKLLKK